MSILFNSSKQSIGSIKFCYRYLQTVAPLKKPTVVVIGTGWAGARATRDLDISKCNLKVLSIRNHMVFTPLLPQTCCGTLEFRSICESITNIKPALNQEENDFNFGFVHKVDQENKVVSIYAPFTDDSYDGSTEFEVPYDIAILCHGAEPNTFGIKGVEENAYFLREIHHARGIRRKLLRNLVLANTPGISAEVRQRLLQVVVVGGGPTGVEFASDLCDFLNSDVSKYFRKNIRSEFTVTLVEAGEVLGTFDSDLREYAARNLEKVGVKLKRAIVKEVHEKYIELVDGEKVSYGLLVWSTGVGPSVLTQRLPVDKTKSKRIATDKLQRVLQDGKPIDGLYAIGDCSGYHEGELPTLAAVAERQAKYVAASVNQLLDEEHKKIEKAREQAKAAKSKAADAKVAELKVAGAEKTSTTVDVKTVSGTPTEKEIIKEPPLDVNDGRNYITVDGKPRFCTDTVQPFTYTHRGSMALVGDHKALIDLPRKRFNMKGLFAWFTWRSAYMTMLGSIRSRMYVAVNWTATILFGRDLTYIANTHEAKILKDKIEKELDELYNKKN